MIFGFPRKKKKKREKSKHAPLLSLSFFPPNKGMHDSDQIEIKAPLFLCLDALVWDTSHSQILLPPFCAAPPSFFLFLFFYLFLWADQASHRSHPFSRFQFPVASAFSPKPLTCTPFSGALITLSIACNNTDVFSPLLVFIFLFFIF